MRGARLWPAFVAALVVEACCSTCCRSPATTAPGPSPPSCSPASPTSSSSRSPRRWPAAGCAGAGPGCRRWSPPTGPGPSCSRPARCSGAGPRPPPERARRARRPRRPGGLGGRFVISQAPRSSRPTSTTRHRQAGRRPLPHVRRRPGPPARLLRLRQHRPVAAGRHARPRPAARTRRWRARGGSGLVVRVALAALRARLHHRGKRRRRRSRPQAVVLGDEAWLADVARARSGTTMSRVGAGTAGALRRQSHASAQARPGRARRDALPSVMLFCAAKRRTA